MNNPATNTPAASTRVRDALDHKIRAGLSPIHLEIINESDRHNVPPGSESHFKVVVVSPSFEGKNLVQRHRMVYSLVGEEMNASVHALALHAYTEADWPQASSEVTDSPNCRGGKAGER